MLVGVPYLSDLGPRANPGPDTNDRRLPDLRPASLDYSRRLDRHVIPNRNPALSTPGGRRPDVRPLVHDAALANEDAASRGVDAGAGVHDGLGHYDDGVVACQDGVIGYCEG